MRPKAQERGQALVIIALAAVGLFGFSALAIDGSRVFSDRRHAQNTADTAALSAALAKIRQEDYVQAARDRAKDNGYTYDPLTNNVEVLLCDAATNPPCQGIPVVDPSVATPEELERATKANYIQVKITSILPATFGRIVGRNEFTNILTAIAYAGPVEPKPLVGGYALAAMERSEWDAIQTAGSVLVQVHNSGVFSNSDYTYTGPGQCNHGSMRTSGTGTIFAEDGFYTVGNFCHNGTGTYTGDLHEASPIDYPPPVDIPDFSCGSTNGSTSIDSAGRTIVSPGNHGNLNFQLGATVIFSPGTHCFNNGLTIQNFEKITADNAQFLFKGGEFKLTGGSLTCNDLQVHVNGGSGLSFGGSGKMFCNNVVFFLSSGNVTMNGNPEYRLYAPSGGDYEGLLFYMPASNDKPISINGNTSCQMTGTILAVSSKITVNGNSWANGLDSQIIGDTVMLAGTGDLILNFNPDNQYQPIDPSSITLSK